MNKILCLALQMTSGRGADSEAQRSLGELGREGCATPVGASFIQYST